MELEHKDVYYLFNIDMVLHFQKIFFLSDFAQF